MTILQGTVEINTQQIDKMIAQISHLENASCAQINLVITSVLGTIKGLMSGIIKEISLLNPLTSLLNLPFPDPVSIVKWLGDLVTGLVGTQVKALIKYTKKLIILSAKLAELIIAVESILPAIARCAGNSLDPSTVLYELKSEVDSTIASSFSSINELTGSLSSISTVFTTTFDTSSPEAFLATVDQNYDQLTSQLKAYTA